VLKQLDTLKDMLVKNDCGKVSDDKTIIKIMMWYNKVRKEFERLKNWRTQND